MVLRQALRDLAAGEVRLLVVALALAVFAVTTIGFLTDRAERALALEANRLLGGDAVLRADAPIPEAQQALARAPGLRSVATVEFNSMIRVGDHLRLGDLRAIGPDFPLRGSFLLREAGGEREATGGPAPGTVWMTLAGANTLGARLGDRVTLGGRSFELAALVVQEPDAVLDYFNVAPRVVMPLSDLESTGLVQAGSRIVHRLVVAGEPDAVEAFSAAVRATLGRGQRLETAADGRPEIRRALDRAGRFLGLATLVSLVLAAVAVAMAARRHSARQLDACAVMRCLGASQATIVRVQVGSLLLLGLLGSTLGVLAAWAASIVLGGLLADALGIAVPSAGLLPALAGYAVGLTVLVAFAVPPVLALRTVPALRVLRRDLAMREPAAWLLGALALGALGALLWWQAGDVELASAMLGGLLATFAVLAALGLLLVRAIDRLRPRLRGPWRYGLANVSRRQATTVAQVAALGLGLMALLLLTFVRTDLLSRWRDALPVDAPNRFIINVQPDQVEALRAFLDAQGIAEPELFPMVRGRLVAVDDRAVSGADFAARGQRAQRLAEREFNLSTATTLAADNRVVEGRFWSDARPAANNRALEGRLGSDARPTAGVEFSVEQGLAETLGWSLGQRVAFDVAGTRLEGTITSLREVEWESFRPNFFVLASPGALEALRASHITAIHLPPGRDDFTRLLLDRFANLSVIDTDAVLNQVRNTAAQVATVVEAVFYVALLAGVLVLLAAVGASQDERLREGAVMRVLGGSRRQLRLAQAGEFAILGLIAGLVAAIAATVLAGVLASQVLELPWRPDFGLAAAGAAAGLLVALLAGLWATRRVLDAPPSVTLREL
ncbi:MAG: FtsX-like permease family protein [Xanthomonadaceae bacterium]|nr:FtsX-like permease family protein [Xanthomonadaceae bacterium]